MEAELRQIREGLHPEFKRERQQLEEDARQRRAEIKDTIDRRTRAAEEAFAAERAAAERAYKHEEDALRERLLNDFEERRKRSDEGRFEGQLSQIRAAEMRKMRTRSDVDTNAAAQHNPANKAKIHGMQYALKPQEVHDDLEELQRGYALIQRQMEEAAHHEEAPAKVRRTAEPKASAPRKPAPRKAPEFDLKGKTLAEVTGQRITVWYEESSNRGKVDVPYPGRVTGHKKDGLTVRFDGSPEDEEELITNDDEWLWGEHRKKPAQLPTGR